MAASVTLTSVVQNNGVFTITYSDGSGQIFDSLDDLRMFISSLDAGSEGTENAKRFLLGWWLARSTDGSNEAIVEGKTLTLDLGNNNPIRVQ